MSEFSSEFVQSGDRDVRGSLAKTYHTISTASVEDLWQKIVDLADVSWHPLLVKTNVPRGLVVKPGLIYQAVTRFLLPVRIFVEGVRPMEMMSIRILAILGIEERVIYRIESTLDGTRVSYSVALKGWLAPLVWSVLRHYAARVAAQLAQAAEQEKQDGPKPHPREEFPF